jgi:phosphate transport system permease protein
MTTTGNLDMDRPAASPAFRGISTGRKVKNVVATTLVGLCFLIAIVPLVWVLYSVVEKGLAPILDVDWWTHSLNGMRPAQAGGGAYHAIIGSVLQALVTTVISVPVGVAVGVYLVEYGKGSRLSKLTTFMVDILTGVPSIVAGLFIYAVWISILGLTRSGFAVSLALLLLMVPVVVRTTEEMLRVVPDELREASYALGVPKWKTIVKIVIPTALSGIVTGVMLGVARVMGETAPALLLVGYAANINFDLFEGNQANLPLMIVSQFSNPTPSGTDRTWGAAMTLILIIMLFNLAATAISRLSAIKTK